MSDEITREVFDHLVELAALELSPEEGEYLRAQLNNQLKAIHELVAIPLDESVPPALHGVRFTRDVSPALREDQWQPFEDTAAITGQAPRFDDGYIIVPDIPHTKLE